MNYLGNWLEIEWHKLDQSCLVNLSNKVYYMHAGWAIRGTVVARWTTGQQIERAILRQGHDS